MGDGERHEGTSEPAVLSAAAEGISARLERSFESVPASARAARGFVAEALAAMGADDDVVSCYLLAASELVTNAIEHGDGSPLAVVVDSSDPEWWSVGVAGRSGEGRAAMPASDAWYVAAAEETSGRGLGIVRHLMDEVGTDHVDGLVSVHCRLRRLPADGAGYR